MTLITLQKLSINVKTTNFNSHMLTPGRGGHTMAQLVETLRYKPEGRGFDSRWCHCNFSLT